MTDIDKNTETDPCPEFPYFGAKYPDARCIDGYLWDLDSWDDSLNGFARGGDVPCPFCNQDEFLAEDPFGIEEDCLMGMDWVEEPSAEQIETARKHASKKYTELINNWMGHYGKRH